MPDTTPTTNSNPPVADDWLIVTEALEAAGWTGADDNPLEILKKDGACWAISNDCYDSAVSKDGWTVEFPSDTPVSVVIAACLAAAPPARQVLGTTDQQPTTAPVDRFRTAWHSARSRAAVLSAEITRRAPLLGEYAAQIANLRTMYDVADARTNDLIEERDQLLTERTAPVDRAAVLAATLREVLDTFGPMTEVYGGPVAYYDGSADITPAQYEGWRAVLDDEPSRMADEAQPATDQTTEAEPESSGATYVVERQDATEWVGITHRCPTIGEARKRRESYRRPRPDVRLRIVRLDETATVVEADRPDTETEAPRLPWSDLLGAAPDITGGACTQCYMDRARDRDHDMSPEHAHCRTVLDGPDTETEAAK